MDIEEKKNRIYEYCDNLDFCKSCPLKNFKGNCLDDDVIDRNYELLFGKDEFSLSDIKPCMVVQIRDGRLCMVIDRGNYLGLSLLDNLDYGIALLDDDYNEFDCCIGGNRYDIINVYGFSTKDILSIKNRPLLWSRNRTEIEQLEKQKLEIEAKLKQLKGE